MSAFNTVCENLVCPVCGQNDRFEIQFKYGNTKQLFYDVGHPLKWGGNDIGNQENDKVIIEGIGGPCNHCGADFLSFYVVIENNIIKPIKSAGVDLDEAARLGYKIVRG